MKYIYFVSFYCFYYIRGLIFNFLSVCLFLFLFLLRFCVWQLADFSINRYRRAYNTKNFSKNQNYFCCFVIFLPYLCSVEMI